MSGASDVARIEARVRGVVQGVGFRWFVVRHANRLALSGWVANEADGSVSVVAEGTAAALDELLGLLRQGPAGASVATVEEQRLPATGLQGFRVRAGGHSGD